MYRLFNPAFSLFNICFSEIITHMKYTYVPGCPSTSLHQQRLERARSHQSGITPISVIDYNGQLIIYQAY